MPACLLTLTSLRKGMPHCRNADHNARRPFRLSSSRIACTHYCQKALDNGLQPMMCCYWADEV